MLSSISWSQYFTFIGVTLLIYYVTVAVKYFKWELLSLAGIQKEEGGLLNNVTIQKFSQQNISEDGEVAGMDISPVIQTFQDEIVAYANEAGTNNPSREELLGSIRSIAAKYRFLAEDENASTRDEIILEEINNRLLISLSHQDLQSLK